MERNAARHRPANRTVSRSVPMSAKNAELVFLAVGKAGVIGIPVSENPIRAGDRLAYLADIPEAGRGNLLSAY
jgi:hypothetical protein